MNETGFSIRCPHCFEWSDWSNLNPKDVVIDRVEEQQGILEGLKKDPLNFSHEKMFCCQNIGRGCPSPFQAFLCQDEKSAHQFVEQVPTWTLRRAFRLYKTDHRNRWDLYSGIIFCTRPVPRLKHIELEQLLNRELLSRALAGISLELNAPITIYAAKVFEIEEKNNIYWVPIEGYTKDIRHVPPRYNLFCDACRTAEISSVLAQFEGKIDPNNCCWNLLNKKACIEGETACTKRDWNHCPSFLDARYKLNMCYWCDSKLIQNLEEKWSKGKLTTQTYETYTCWAGFQQLAVPIVVHEHLIAVGMTGQFVVNKSKLVSINKLIEDYPILEPYRDKLQISRDLLFGNREPVNEQEKYTKEFYINKEKFKEKADQLIENAERIAAIAIARYRDVRSRSEVVFKEETIGQIEASRARPGFFRESLSIILNRMREFWAFKAVYFINYPLDTKELHLVACSRKNTKPEFFPFRKVIGIVEHDLSRRHPLPWLYDSSRKDSFGNLGNPWVNKFREILDHTREDFTLGIPTGRYYFLVLVPFVDQISAFLFAVRDEDAVSPLRSLEKGGISELCQESILETCTTAMGKLYELTYQEARERKMKLDAWRALSARTAHKINSRLFAARGAIRRQRQVNPNSVGITELEYAIEKIGLICNDFIRFSTDQPLNLQQVNVEDLIRKEVDLYKQAVPEKHISIDIPGPVPECKWDPLQIGQAITELLENAINYSPPASRISISTQPFKKNSVSLIRIVVYNEGPGVEQGNKTKIFEPFFSTRPEGAGLGLSIVEKIVENHKGTIHEVGEPGKNAKFVVELPIQLK